MYRDNDVKDSLSNWQQTGFWTVIDDLLSEYEVLTDMTDNHINEAM